MVAAPGLLLRVILTLDLLPCLAQLDPLVLNVALSGTKPSRVLQAFFGVLKDAQAIAGLCLGMQKSRA